jgi:Flp pilus assembly protein TadD
MAELAWIYAEMGNKSGALSEIDSALRLAPANNAVLFRTVMVAELTGDRPRALAALESLAKTGAYLEEIQKQPGLKSLRDDPHYKEQEKTWPPHTR